MNLLLNKAFAINLRLHFALFLLFLSIPFVVLIEFGLDISYAIIPIIILIIAYLFWRFRNVQLLTITIVYISIYFCYLIPYFFYNIQLSEYTLFQNKVYFSKILLLFYLFFVGLATSAINDFNPHKIPIKDLINFSIDRGKEFCFVLFLFYLFYLVSKEGENVLNSSTPYLAYMRNLESSSSLSLFFLLFLSLFYLLVRKKFLSKSIFWILVICFIGYCSTRGFRMVLAPLFLLLYLLFLEFKIGVKSLLLLLLFGFAAVVSLNYIKMGSYNLSDFLSEGNHDFIISHHADNLYGSAAGMGLLDDGKITLIDRILLTVGFGSEIVVPASFLPNTMKYPHIVGINADTGGGGLFLTGAYLMWGYIGVLLFGYFFAEFIRSIYIRKNIILALIAIIVLMFSPRWISYDFHVILRFPFMGIIIYTVARYLVWKKY